MATDRVVGLKAILPKKISKDPRFTAQLAILLYDFVRETDRLLMEPTKDWKHDVERSVKSEAKGTVVTAEVRITDPPYIYLDQGTVSHMVKPKYKKALHWVQNEQSFFSKGHMVKGIKARKWTNKVTRKQQAKLRRDIKALIKRVKTVL